MTPLDRLLLPDGAQPQARPLLLARALRALIDGAMAIVLPAYLLALGYGSIEVGLIATATLLGSALATIALGAWAHRVSGAGVDGSRHLLCAAALLMAFTGAGFAAAGSFHAFWPLLLIAFVGTLNPSSGDVSVFLPLEHARLAHAAEGGARTALYARYSLIGTLGAAIGALGAGLPDLLERQFGIAPLDTLRALFVAYALIGLAVFTLYRRLGDGLGGAAPPPSAPLGPSRRVVTGLAMLFAVDSFAGGLVINALLALWLLQRFDVSLATAGSFFFWTGLLGAVSQLLAPKLAQRIGLVNTMVFTHLPANLCLIAAALAPTLPLATALLLVRASLSQMDVPARSALVMTVVTPAERAAAASFTAVPKSLAAALAPSLGGALFAAGWIAAPLVLCGVLKAGYDLVLWRVFGKIEQRGR
jgi:MFS family permease